MVSFITAPFTSLDLLLPLEQTREPTAIAYKTNKQQV